MPERKDAAASGFVALHMGGDARWTRRDYAALAREGFMRNPIVYRAVRLVAETAAAVPWLLYEGETEQPQHPLLALLERPNPRQAGGSFFEALYGHLLLAGNAYVELVEAGALRELHLLRPDRVTVIADAGGWPVGLEYGFGRQKRRLATADASAGGALHMSLFHPLDDLCGFPPLEAASMALDTHNAAGRWNKALLDNSARPSGALVYAPKDMDFIEARNGASRDIALAFGVPPMLLGIPGDNTYANYQEANRAFYRMTVLPLVARTAKEFSAWIGPLFGGPLRLWYDADQVDGLAGERDALWARVNAAGFLTDDEKRQAVGYGARGRLDAKAGFNPDQPRVPAGDPAGGQWSGEGVRTHHVRRRRVD